MPYKNIEDKRASQRKHYHSNKRDILRVIKKRKNGISLFIRELKDNQPCVDCGDKYPYYVMDFDHTHDKEIGPSRMSSMGWGLERIQKELNKCELVCSNCHRERTHKRRISLV